MKNITLENGIDFYSSRLEYVKLLFLEGKKELVFANRGKTEKLLEKYKTFKNNPLYNPLLVKSIERFMTSLN
jgi:hypothetical protein